MAGPSGEQPLDAAIGKSALNGKRLGQLHLDIVEFSDMETAVDRLLTLGAGMEKCQHLAARIHGRKQMRNHRRHQWFGQVVERGPEQRHVKGAPGKVEGMVQEAPDIPHWVALRVDAGLPVPGAGIVDQIGQEDAMAEAGEVVDV